MRRCIDWGNYYREGRCRGANQPLEQTTERKPWWKSTTNHEKPSRAVTIDLGNPGAVTLVFQAILPFLLFSPSPQTTGGDVSSAPVVLTLKGGTNVPLSPSIDYIAQVLLPNLELLGLPPIRLSDTNATVRGWTTGRPKMGEATFIIPSFPPGASLSPLRIPQSRGPVSRISVTLLAPGKLLRRELIALVQSLVQDRSTHLRMEDNGAPVEVAVDEESGDPKRLYLLLVAHTTSGIRVGRDWLYDGKISKAENGLRDAGRRMVLAVVEGLATELDGEEHGKYFDEHLEDQLVVFIALANGRSCAEGGAHGDDAQEGERRQPSLHTMTARFVVEKVLGAEFASDGSCRGIGFAAGARFHGLENDQGLEDSVCEAEGRRGEEMRNDDELIEAVETLRVRR